MFKVINEYVKTTSIFLLLTLNRYLSIGPMEETNSCSKSAKVKQ